MISIPNASNQTICLTGAAIGAALAYKYDPSPEKIALGAIIGLIVARAIFAPSHRSEATINWNTSSDSLAETARENAGQAVDRSFEAAGASSKATTQAAVKKGTECAGTGLKGSVAFIPGGSVLNSAIDAGVTSVAKAIKPVADSAIDTATTGSAALTKRVVQKGISSNSTE